METERKGLGGGMVNGREGLGGENAGGDCSGDLKKKMNFRKELVKRISINSFCNLKVHSNQKINCYQKNVMLEFSYFSSHDA